MSYDDWRTNADAAPDPGRGGGCRPHKLMCHDCQWSVRNTSMIAAVAAAQEHIAESGHEITYKGVVQQWSTMSR